MRQMMTTKMTSLVPHQEIICYDSAEKETSPLVDVDADLPPEGLLPARTSRLLLRENDVSVVSSGYSEAEK